MVHLVLWFLLLTATTPALVLSQLVPTASDMAAPPPMPDCPDMCGKTHIPYPFGIGEGCAIPGVDGFNLTCNDSFNPPAPYFGNVEIIDITLEAGEMRVFTPVAHICSNESYGENSSSYWFDLSGWPFQISPERNEFTAIGCNTVAILEGREDWSYYTGCITTCTSIQDAAGDGEPCAGLGCCQTPSIPGNLSTIQIDWPNYTNSTVVHNPPYSPCSYAFLAEKHWYNFSRKDLNITGGKAYNKRFGERTIPLVLEWAITDHGTCPTQSKKPTAPACVSANSYCVNKTIQGPAYLCNCSQGYEGNPYVSGGCKNINECKLRKSDLKLYEKLYPCRSGSTCRDTDGSYECKCKLWQRGDGKSDEGCQAIFPAYAVAIVATFTAGLILVLLVWYVLKEREKLQRRGFFDRNGGELVKRMGINIYTKEQLDKITQNYSTNIGNGAFGKVYMGTTEDNQQVAVKLSIVEGKIRQQHDLVNEITVQFRVNHSNLVRLVGCCLETNVPRLVFEFIANGSLYHVLHGAEKRALSLPTRLDIAIGSAEALSYMHSLDGHNIIVHGDVKSGNILLGENFVPKVSDFGSSKIVSVTKFISIQSVTADLNYIDPVYIKTGRFTDKSDVYSFGVVLLELITRKKAKYDGSKSLPIDFVKAYRDEGTRREMFDKELFSVAQPDRCMEYLNRIGGIAIQCLKEDVDERPTMKQVLEDLKQVKFGVCGFEVMGNN